MDNKTKIQWSKQCNEPRFKNMKVKVPKECQSDYSYRFADG